MAQQPRTRPLRYRGIDLRPGRERPRVRLAGAILLAAISLWTSVAVVRGLVLVAEGTPRKPVFWPTVAVMCVIVAVTVRYALLLWRKSARARGRSGIS